jgi:endogenous inhibitor of DNA gyrase (YacG/DUF329 family)
MARWVLACPECQQEFTHSEIVPSALRELDPFTRTEVKPEFPSGGLNVLCPHCSQPSVYQRYQLLYRAI